MLAGKTKKDGLNRDSFKSDTNNIGENIKFIKKLKHQREIIKKLINSDLNLSEAIEKIDSENIKTK